MGHLERSNKHSNYYVISQTKWPIQYFYSTLPNQTNEEYTIYVFLSTDTQLYVLLSTDTLRIK